MIAEALERGVRRAAFGAATTARVGWYTAFYVAGRHVLGPLSKPGEVPRPNRSRPPSNR